MKRMNKGDKYYMEITTWLLENHNEVYDEWNEFHYKIIEEKRLTDIEKEKEEIERKKPQLLELANWCEVNKEWLESLPKESDFISAILLSIDLMIEAAYDGNLQKIGTYKTAISSIAYNIPELHVVGYLKDGRRVITPFNHCWNHTHGDDVKFDSNTEYDWREEE